MADNTMVKDLFANLVHVGHKAEKWNPKMKTYLHSKVNGVWVFDLEKTAEALKKAEQFLKALKLQNKTVLFVGTKPQAALEIKKKVEPKGFYFVDKKWTPGLLTNFKELRKRADYYLDLKQQFSDGGINKYTKKEIAKFKKDLEKLEASYGGVAEMRKAPGVVIVLDGVLDRLAIDEANNAGIPVVAIGDANVNPDGIDYLIPGNDDAIKSIGFLLENMLNCLK